MPCGFREASKKDWVPSEPATIETIQTGALLRIADATEKMAANYEALLNDRDRYKRWYQEESARNTKKDRQIAGLRGAFKRLKNKSKK